MKASRNPWITPDELRAWMRLRGLTHRSAADRLDVVKSTITGYLGGVREIPKILAMAIWADINGYPHRSAKQPAKDVQHQVQVDQPEAAGGRKDRHSASPQTMTALPKPLPTARG